MNRYETAQKKLAFLKRAKAHLLKTRELLYGQIDQVNLTLEKIGVNEEELKACLTKLADILDGSELEASMKRHPAGRKQKSDKP